VVQEQPQATEQIAISAPPAPASRPASNGCEPIISLLEQYDWDTRIALAIIKAESGCNTNAVGDNYPINGLYAPSCGYAQIRTLTGRPTCEQLQDPATNIAWMYKISGGGTNWRPWSVFASGKYLQYIN
jgi:hypothetical protein